MRLIIHTPDSLQAQDDKALAEIRRRDTVYEEDQKRYQDEKTAFNMALCLTALKESVNAGGKVAGVVGTVAGGVVGPVLLSVADSLLLTGVVTAGVLSAGLIVGAGTLLLVTDTLLISSIVLTGALTFLPALCDFGITPCDPCNLRSKIPSADEHVKLIDGAIEVGSRLVSIPFLLIFDMERKKFFDLVCRVGFYITAAPGALIGAMFSPARMLYLEATRHFHYDSAIIQKVHNKLSEIGADDEKFRELIDNIAQKYHKNFFTSQSSLELLDFLVGRYKDGPISLRISKIIGYLEAVDFTSEKILVYKNQGKRLFNIIIEETLKIDMRHEKRDHGYALLVLLGKHHLITGLDTNRLCRDVIGVIGEYLSTHVNQAASVFKNVFDETYQDGRPLKESSANFSRLKEAYQKQVGFFDGNHSGSIFRNKESSQGTLAEMRLRLDAQKYPNGAAAKTIHNEWMSFASSTSEENIQKRKDDITTQLQIIATAVKEYEKQTTGVNFFFTNSSKISKILRDNIKKILACNYSDAEKMRMIKKEIYKITADTKSNEKINEWKSKSRFSSIMKRCRILDVNGCFSDTFRIDKTCKLYPDFPESNNVSAVPDAR